MEVWHFLHAAEEVVRAGVFHSIAPGSESVSPFHLFHLSLIGQLWWVLLFLVWVLLCLGLLLLLLVDQSVRSSYLPMTSLAQFRDCHSCYDERSIDPKKNSLNRAG